MRKQKSYVFWTKGGKFETDDVNLVRQAGKRGKLHRVGGPAFEDRLTTLEGWYFEGRLHRLDGPAVSDSALFNGGSWWIHGKQLVTEEVTQWILENDVDLKTDEGKMAFKMRWS